ncbi:MAG: restriction endonuclease subunit R [Flavobacteriaceae bacterium]|nr:restriction endonuclease subunit R [Flavobacteriaceae bacterium]|tara:strand:- start:50059 stop:50505 length:447 start_codon:yes stop_codon:yes gene_type:complete
MYKLNFPLYQIPLKNKENKTLVFDSIRKKWLKLVPEEWVRLNCIEFLINEKKISRSLISVEKEFKLNNLKKRFDIVVFNKKGEIYLLVECKAPNVKISQSVFNQITKYNLVLKSKFLMISNGINHYFFSMNFESQKIEFLKELPYYDL